MATPVSGLRHAVVYVYAVAALVAVGLGALFLARGNNPISAVVMFAVAGFEASRGWRAHRRHAGERSELRQTPVMDQISRMRSSAIIVTVCTIGVFVVSPFTVHRGLLLLMGALLAAGCVLMWVSVLWIIPRAASRR